MAGGLVLAGCSDEVTQPLPLSRAPAASAVIAPGDDRPDEAEMRAFAERIPGLGGYHFEDGELVVSLTDPSRADAARAALAGVARRGNGRMRVRPAQYTFQQLRAWRDGWWDRILDIPGVSFVDLDEAANRVVVGLAEPAARARVLELLRPSGIPVPALGFASAGYPQPHGGQVEYAPYRNDAPSQGDSITSYRRPLEGGLKISYRHSSDPTLSTGCTMGFIAVLNGVRVGITASHCSVRQWDLDATSYFQAQPGAGRYFGYEYKDPNGHSCGFLSVNVCRGSEASAVLLEGDVANSLGYIVRPLGPVPEDRSPYGVRQSSLLVDPANPNLRIASRLASEMGIVIYKVGAATGWTKGKVSKTCVDMAADRPNSKLRCQYWASYSSAGGDSGAPVFGLNPDGTASLAGLNWGIINVDGQESATYTSLGSIERDLGILQFTAGTSSGGGDPADGGGTDPGDGGGNCPPSCVS
jgi:hypothetical protein